MECKHTRIEPVGGYAFFKSPVAVAITGTKCADCGKILSVERKGPRGITIKFNVLTGETEIKETAKKG